MLVGRGGTVLMTIGLAALLVSYITSRGSYNPQAVETVRILAIWTIPVGLLIALPWLVESLRSRFQRPRVTQQ